MSALRRRDLARITDRLGAKATTRRHLQDGVKFRTLCARCNNELLGGRYDPELQVLCQELAVPLRLIARAQLHIPSRFAAVIRPNLVAKAIAGHLLAGRLREDMTAPPESAPFPDLLRRYFLDPTARLPEGLEIYCWPYPSEVQVIAQAIGGVWLGTGTLLIFAVLKFFPLGFLVAFERPPALEMKPPLLVRDREAATDASQMLGFDFRKDVPRIDWPEKPDDDGRLVYLLDSEQALISSPARADQHRRT